MKKLNAAMNRTSLKTALLGLSLFLLLTGCNAPSQNHQISTDSAEELLNTTDVFPDIRSAFEYLAKIELLGGGIIQEVNDDVILKLAGESMIKQEKNDTATFCIYLKYIKDIKLEGTDFFIADDAISLKNGNKTYYFFKFLFADKNDNNPRVQFIKRVVGNAPQ